MVTRPIAIARWYNDFVVPAEEKGDADYDSYMGINGATKHKCRGCSTIIAAHHGEHSATARHAELGTVMQ
jgi:hypothetical protein